MKKFRLHVEMRAALLRASIWALRQIEVPGLRPNKHARHINRPRDTIRDLENTRLHLIERYTIELLRMGESLRGMLACEITGATRNLVEVFCAYFGVPDPTPELV